MTGTNKNCVFFCRTKRSIQTSLLSILLVCRQNYSITEKEEQQVYSTVIIVGKRGNITIPIQIREDLQITDGEALRITKNLDGTLTIERVGK